MFRLPKHYELFLAQLPTDVDSCLQDIRQYASFLKFATQSGDFQMIFDVENILCHLRYRHLILTDADDDESRAFKLLYECELPEMIYRKESPPILTFGDFDLPIVEGTVEFLECKLDDEIVEDFSLPVEDMAISYIEPSQICHATTTSVASSCDSVIVDGLKDHIVEPLKQVTVRNCSTSSCFGCNSSEHRSPLILGSEFKPVMCRQTEKRDTFYASCADDNPRHPLAEAFKNLKHNLRIGKRIKVDENFDRVCIGLHLATGDSFYHGTDYVVYTNKQGRRDVSLQRIALSNYVRCFLDRLES